jgi:hypothetical protein
MTNPNIPLTNVAINLLNPVTGEISPVCVLFDCDAVGAYLEDNDCSIVSLDADPDGVCGFYAVVAADDSETSTVALATKLDIALELEELEDDLIPVLVEGISLGNPVGESALPEPFFPEDDEDLCEPTPIPAVTLTKKEFKAKQAAPPKKKKVHTYLCDMILANPGVSRVDVFMNSALRIYCGADTVAIKRGDKLAIKRYNRRLNRFLRQIRRDGHDLQVVRTNNVAAYTIVVPVPAANNLQLTLPFAGDNDVTNVAIEEKAITRGDEALNQSLDFDSLLATLDDEAVSPVA